MLRRTFGNSPLEVSAISLGCWIFGVDWWGHYSDERGVELCQFAYDHGVTFFDNGDAYGNGRAETILGKWIRESGVSRERIEIGGKIAHTSFTDPGAPGAHPERPQAFSAGVFARAPGKYLQPTGGEGPQPAPDPTTKARHCP